MWFKIWLQSQARPTGLYPELIKYHGTVGSSIIPLQLRKSELDCDPEMVILIIHHGKYSPAIACSRSGVGWTANL